MRGVLVLLLLLALAPLAAASETPVVLHAGTTDEGVMYFEPATIRITEGERIALTLANDDPSTPHDWALLEYDGVDIEVYARGGERRTIHFTASEPGTFRFVCQVVGHKQRGMEGTLAVEESRLVPGLGPAAFCFAALIALFVRRPRP